MIKGSELNVGESWRKDFRLRERKTSQQQSKCKYTVRFMSVAYGLDLNPEDMLLLQQKLDLHNIDFGGTMQIDATTFTFHKVLILSFHFILLHYFVLIYPSKYVEFCSCDVMRCGTRILLQGTLKEFKQIN